MVKMQEDVVLCKIYRKATPLKIIEQRAAVEDHQTKSVGPILSSPQSQESPEENFGESLPQSETNVGLLNAMEEDQDIVSPSSSSVKLGCLKYCNLKDLGMLDVPKFSMDSTNDSVWAQLRSPWLDYWSPGALSSLLNY